MFLLGVTFSMLDRSSLRFCSRFRLSLKCNFVDDSRRKAWQDRRRSVIGQGGGPWPGRQRRTSPAGWELGHKQRTKAAVHTHHGAPF